MRADHRYALFAIVASTFAAADVFAGAFEVQPTRLDLARRGASTELVIANHGAASTRFETKVYVWAQDDRGVMQLTPATDVVVYPTLFAIEPGASRTIRIATTSGPSSTERSYRVFLEELPQAKTTATAGMDGAVAVLTRIGVPLFVATTKPEVSGTVAAAVTHGALELAVQNAGSVHVKLASIHVAGRDAAGSLVVDQEHPSWYLLAGGTLRYELPLGADCARITSLDIEARTDRGTWRSTLSAPAIACQTE